MYEVTGRAESPEKSHLPRRFLPIRARSRRTERSETLSTLGTHLEIVPDVRCNAVGKSNLVLDLSCRRKDGAGDYYVVTDRWQKYTDFVLSEQSLAELATYCDEFLVHGVDVEGMRVGIIEELVTLLGVWSPIPVT